MPGTRIRGGSVLGAVDTLTTDVGRIDTTRQIEAIRRRWLLIAFITLVFMALAAAATFVMPKTYESTTSLLVAPVTDSTTADVANTRTTGEINLDTEAQIVRSAALAEAVSKLIITNQTIADIADAVSVTVPSNSQVLNITFTASTAKAAHAGAEAYATAYLEQRRAGAEQVIQDSQASIQKQLDTLQKEFTQATSRSHDSDLSEVDRAVASSTRDALASQISTLNASLSSLSRTVVDPGHVISAANLPTSPASPSLKINLAVGLVVGLLIGIALAVLLGHLDHRLLTPRDIRAPRGVRIHTDLLTGVARLDDVDPKVDDEVDQLRLNIDSSGRIDPRTVLVAPVGEEASADLIAISLGRAYARRLGYAVCAIADADSPVPTELGIAGPGLTDLFTSDAEIEPTAIDGSGLSAFGPGTSPDSLSGLLQRPGAMSRVPNPDGEVLIVATPALHHSVGAQAILKNMDRIVLIGRSKDMDDRELARTMEAIARSPFNGSVVIGMTAQAPKRGVRARASRDKHTAKHDAMAVSPGDHPRAAAAHKRDEEAVTAGARSGAIHEIMDDD